uniref:guanylate cyclase n=1 Tax=Anisakis simplex TaxID=6269 RepID=A0A0M3KJK6_ANISI
LLWTAPEVLKSPAMEGSKSGDIYSFAIIASELLCLTPPWNIEIIYMVEHGLKPPLRPDLSAIVHQDINPAMVELKCCIRSMMKFLRTRHEINNVQVHVVRDCWSEDPEKRPTATMLKTLLRKMNPGRNHNLMDHVFSILESYAGRLEGEVEERTKELIAEKKKSDLLLYRMLPKYVL